MDQNVVYLSEDKIGKLTALTMPVYEEMSPWLNKKKPVMLVIPGGSYMYCSDREGLPVAFKFMAKGYQAFVLNYHVKDQSDYPTSFLDLANAIKHIKDHADEYGIDKNEISILGFSAGGHLAGTYAALIDNEEFQKEMGLSKEELEIKNLVLGYPALHLKPVVDAVYQYKVQDKVGELFKNYKEIKDGYTMAHKNMPRTFVFHAIDDDVVPAVLSIEYVNRLLSLGVEVEFYLSSLGGHGFATGDDLSNYGRGINPRISVWTDLVDQWIRDKMV